MEGNMYMYIVTKIKQLIIMTEGRQPKVYIFATLKSTLFMDK